MSSPTAVKRQKERARQDRQREKTEKRQQRRNDQPKGRDSSPAAHEEDPDIAGIVPGPQPPLDDFVD